MGSRLENTRFPSVLQVVMGAESVGQLENSVSGMAE
jgi:hypothetical protein